ncbi:MAG TPA: hypothetical protein PLI95_09340, partial [Polyangiaceae bacterium]|nr:hypothetical protein [Polyangiaceae bacterium]
MRTLLALSVPLSLIAACEASRPPAPAAPTPPRPPASASAPAASASAAAVRSAPVPVSLAPVDDDPLAPLPRGAISRGGTTRMRTVRDTESVAVSDDGRSVWAVERGSSGDCVVRDLGRGSTLFTLQSCREPVLAHDGSFVVANVDKATGEIALFRTSDGQRLRGTNVPLPTVVTKFLKRAMTGRAVVESIHVSGDDKRVAVVTSAGKVHVIDAERGRLSASHALDGRLVGLDRTGARALAVLRTTGFFSLDPQGWFVVDLRSGRVLRKVDPKPESAASSTAAAPGPSARASVALAWDGRSVLAKEGNTLWSIDIETGNATELWKRESST